MKDIVLIIDQNKSHNEDDSEFSEKEYKHKNFKIQKYEKFKPKPIIKNNRSLRGAENKVKNLLSNFLKNYENEGHPLIYNKLNKAKTKKNIEINQNTNNNKRLKKVKTALSNKKLKTTTSYLEGLNYNPKETNMINTPDEIEYYKNQKGYNNNLIKRIKRNKTCGKIKKRDNSNKFIQIPSSKNVLVNNTNYSYLNFKNGITESQKPNNNLFGFKSLFKTKKGILKSNNKINIFNDSIQDSLLTDLSN